MDNDSQAFTCLQRLLDGTTHTIDWHGDDELIYVNITLMLRTTKYTWPDRPARVKEISRLLKGKGVVGKLVISTHGRKGCTYVRPIIAIETMLWADSTLLYKYRKIGIKS